jgi:hypothetical protein
MHRRLILFSVLAAWLVGCGEEAAPQHLGEWVLVEGVDHCIPMGFSASLSITENHIAMTQDFSGSCQLRLEAPYLPDGDVLQGTSLAEGRDCDSCGELFRLMAADAQKSACEPLACLAELPYEGRTVTIGQCPNLHNFGIGGAYLFNTRGDDELLMNFGFLDAVMVFRRPATY